MSKLLQSRRFLTLMVDVILSITAYFVAKYAGPDIQDDVKFLIITLQPVFIAVVAAFTVEDVQAIKATAAVDIKRLDA